MKDQRALLNRCMSDEDEIPVFVLCGNDFCSIEALKEYYTIAKRKGCSEAFLADLQLLINDFELFQKIKPNRIKQPD